MYDSEEDDAKFRNVGWAIWFGLTLAVSAGVARLLVKADSFDSEASYYLAFVLTALAVSLALNLLFAGVRTIARSATRKK